MTTKRKKVEFPKRVNAFIKEEQKLLKHHKVARSINVHFPRHKNVPIIARIAIRILNVYGGKFNVQFIDLKK